MKILKSALIALTVNLLATNSVLAATQNSVIVDSCKAAAPQELSLDANAEIRLRGISGSGRVKKVLLRVTTENDNGFNVQCKINVKSQEIKGFKRL